MDVIRNGLLNREMLRSIKERWLQGGIGVLYVHLFSLNPTLEAVLHQWEGKEERLFWRQRLENEYFFLISRKQMDGSVEKMTKQLFHSLSSRLREAAIQKEAIGEKDMRDVFKIGHAIAFPSGTGRSTETVVYRMLLEALVHSENSHSLLNRDAEAIENKEHLESNVSEGRTSDEDAQDTFSNGKQITIGQLATPIHSFDFSARVSEIADLVDTNPKIQGAVIVKQRRPIGLIMKEKLHQLLAGQFGLPLYWNRSIVRIMNDQALIVDEHMPLEQVSQLAMARDFSQLYDVVVITKEGLLAGAASIRSILESMTVMRTEAARTANPLTGLPGNIGIQMELRRRIARKQSFAVIYGDLDYFKWFNDCFGFGLGDDLIRYVADLLIETIKKYGKSGDFVGHIGGDDFIMVTESSYAEELCQSLIRQFDIGVTPFYGGVSVTSVEDRHGNLIKQEGVTLSLSLMICDGGALITPEYISTFAAKLKKQAKAKFGSTYVIDHISGSQYGEERNKR